MSCAKLTFLKVIAILLFGMSQFCCLAIAHTSIVSSDCESIVVGECVGAQEEVGSTKSGLHTPTAAFRISEFLRGPRLPKLIRFKYQIDDSANRAVTNWKLPSVGSKCVLFIPSSTNLNHNPTETFVGGSLPFDEDLVQGIREKALLDSSLEILAPDWTSWQKNINGYLKSIEDRSGLVSCTAPNQGRLVAIVAYTITQDGQIEQAHLIKKSNSETFDQCALEIVSSMSERPFLRFPKGSKILSVDRSFTFENHLWFDGLM